VDGNAICEGVSPGTETGASDGRYCGFGVHLPAPEGFGEVFRQRQVLDGRNTLAREAWTAARWTHRAQGRRAGRSPGRPARRPLRSVGAGAPQDGTDRPHEDGQVQPQ
jgi:hypothetical protein